MRRIIVTADKRFAQIARTHEMFADAPILRPEDVKRDDIVNAFVASDRLPAELAVSAALIYALRLGRLTSFVMREWCEPEWSLGHGGIIGGPGDNVCDCDNDNYLFNVNAQLYCRTIAEPVSSPIVEDFWAGGTHIGFCVVTRDLVLASTGGDYVYGITRLLRTGRTFVASGFGGEKDLYIASVDNFVEALNSSASVLSIDTNRSGAGKALLLLSPGAVVRFDRYKCRGPARIGWYCGGGEWMYVDGVSTARALGWITSDGEKYEDIL